MDNRPAVLIVDDNASMRTILSLSLQRAGYPSVTAADGHEALRLLATRPFFYMVTDGRMAPMDGFELARRAKALRPEIRIAMASAVFTFADAADAPIERVFEKPLAVSAVVAWLQSGLMGRTVP